MWVWILAAVVGATELAATHAVDGADRWVPDPARGEAPALTEAQMAACAAGEPMPLDGLGHATLRLTSEDGLTFSGQPVVPLVDGAYPADALRGQLLVPLHEVLAKTRDDLEVLSLSGCTSPVLGSASGTLVVEVDGALPFSLVRTLLFTAGQARFGAFRLRTDGTLGEGDFDRPPPDSTSPLFSVMLDGSGFRVGLGTGGLEHLPCSDQACGVEDALDFDGLRDRLRGAAAEDADALVVVVPESRVPWSSVLRTLSTVAVDGDGGPLLPRLMLAGGVAGTTLEGPTWSGVPGLPPPLEPGQTGTGLSAVLPAVQAPGAKKVAGKAGSSPIVLGALDRDVVDKVVRNDLDGIRACYNRELKKQPKLLGMFALSFVIDATGEVTEVGVKQDTIGSKRFTKCMVRRFEAMRFPEPSSGGIVRVSYPFVFQPH